jgi:serine-type D-Ala-D-Ala endopeptidase (penicillin-binding protein 7)
LPNRSGFHNVCAVPTPLSRWALLGVIATLFAASPALTPSAHAASAKKKGKPTAAGGHAHAHAKTHGRAVAKKEFLERHVVAIKGGLPNVQALGALVLDESGHELYTRNPDRERPIASISKLAATLVVMDKGLELEGLSTIAKGDLDVARGGAKSRLLEGMTLSNRDLLHAALMGSDNRAIPALGRAVKLTPSQLATAMTAKAKALGLKNTRFHDPTGLSTENVSTPRETIVMLKAVMNHPVLGPITHRLTYDAHPVGKPPITYNNTYKPAVRTNIQVLGGKTGYNDDARYCLVIATKIDGHTYFMSFLSNEGKLTRFGDVARVADWVVARHPQQRSPGAGAGATATAMYVAPPASPGAPAGTGANEPGHPSDPRGASDSTGKSEPTATGTSEPTVTGTSTVLPIGVAAPPPADPEPVVR